MKNLLLVITLMVVLTSCSKSINEINTPLPDWGYYWCVNKSFYSSSCYIIDKEEIKDLQLNCIYYSANWDNYEVMPSWDNVQKHHCKYVATHIEGNYECDVYHTNAYACPSKGGILPLDCYVMFRFLPGNQPKADRLFDIQVFKDFYNRESTVFTILVEESRNNQTLKFI